MTPICEQETIVRITRDEENAVVYTSDLTMMTKLDKLVETSGEWYLVKSTNFKDGTIADKTYECPKQMISFRSVMPKGRPMTEEQKAALAEGRRAWRENNS